jgi:hypothetical protein
MTGPGPAAIDRGPAAIDRGPAAIDRDTDNGQLASGVDGPRLGAQALLASVTVERAQYANAILKQPGSTWRSHSSNERSVTRSCSPWA